MRQEQFLDVIDRDEAERRFRAALDLHSLPSETVALCAALGRVLSEDVVAPSMCRRSTGAMSMGSPFAPKIHSGRRR